MIRLWLALFGKVALLCALAVGAIRAQPREDAAMRAMLTPPAGCAPPCFLGIRPGVTTRDEALAILRVHPWVKDLMDDTTGISWRWRDIPQLGSLPDGSPSTPFLAGILYKGDKVDRISMDTSIMWGDFLLLFGSPDQVSIENIRAPSVAYHLFGAVYNAQHFEIQTMTQCPINSPRSLWYSTVYMVWQPVLGLVRSNRSGQAATIGSC
jgi:hypothetical protein